MDTLLIIAVDLPEDPIVEDSMAEGPLVEGTPEEFPLVCIRD